MTRSPTRSMTGAAALPLSGSSARPGAAGLSSACSCALSCATPAAPLRIGVSTCAATLRASAPARWYYGRHNLHMVLQAFGARAPIVCRAAARQPVTHAPHAQAKGAPAPAQPPWHAAARPALPQAPRAGARARAGPRVGIPCCRRERTASSHWRVSGAAESWPNADAGKLDARLQVGAHVHGQRGQQAAHGVNHARPHRVLGAAALRHAHPQRVAACTRAHDGRRRAGRAVGLRRPITNRLVQDSDARQYMLARTSALQQGLRAMPVTRCSMRHSNSLTNQSVTFLTKLWRRLSRS